MVTSWNDVPSGSIVQALVGGDRRIGYRYIDMGRWVEFANAWQPGDLVWSWTRPHVDDFVVIAGGVAPGISCREFALLCQRDYANDEPMIRLSRGDLVNWMDVPCGSLVVNVATQAVCLRHADGSGWWIRSDSYSGDGLYWEEMEYYDRERWSWSTERWACPQVRNVRTDVHDQATLEETTVYLHELIGGLNKTWWPVEAKP